MKIEDVERLTRHLHERRLLHSCLTCVYFDAPNEICGLYSVRPPATVIAYGCASWADLLGDQFVPPAPLPLTW